MTIIQESVEIKDNFVLHLGGLHTEMSFLGAVGNLIIRITGVSLDISFLKSDIISSGEKAVMLFYNKKVMPIDDCSKVVE